MISQKKIEAEKSRIISICKKCEGSGCSYCQKYCSFIDDMANANIPTDYWFRELDSWYGDKDFLKWLNEKIISNLSLIYSKGNVLCLVGPRGVGKSMAACNILKKTILDNYTAYYTSFVDLVSCLISYESYDYRKIIKMTDFLVIDEVDQRFFDNPNSKTLYGSQFEYTIRTRTQNKLPTIICSNSEQIDDIFFNDQTNESFQSLKSQFFDVMRIGGKDVRPKEGNK